MVTGRRFETTMRCCSIGGSRVVGVGRVGEDMTDDKADDKAKTQN